VTGALYPFGHGLSYTTFEYSNLKIEQKTKHAGSPVMVSVDVKNSGSVAGDEVVQLYLRDVAGSVITYESQLRGFERVHILPGETKTVSFTILPEDMEILDANYRWVVEPGYFTVKVGSSSEDIRLTGRFAVE
jgi:beta-glucosidase